MTSFFIYIYSIYIYICKFPVSIIHPIFHASPHIFLKRNNKTPHNQATWVEIASIPLLLEKIWVIKESVNNLREQGKNIGKGCLQLGKQVGGLYVWWVRPREGGMKRAAWNQESRTGELPRRDGFQNGPQKGTSWSSLTPTNSSI